MNRSHSIIICYKVITHCIPSFLSCLFLVAALPRPEKCVIGKHSSGLCADYCRKLNAKLRRRLKAKHVSPLLAPPPHLRRCFRKDMPIAASRKQTKIICRLFVERQVFLNEILHSKNTGAGQALPEINCAEPI